MWGLGTHQGRATGLNVTIAATTLAGLDDLPGELDGHGTIPADLARALAASAATITAVAVNPTCGTALDLGRTAYRPRQAQRDYVNQTRSNLPVPLLPATCVAVSTGPLRRILPRQARQRGHLSLQSRVPVQVSP